MKKLYDKNELWFALVWGIGYCIYLSRKPTVLE